MMNKTLVLGGISSGKSNYAEGLFAHEAAPCYIATASAYDDEMREKITKHQARRDKRWVTYEVDLALAQMIEDLGGRAILVDCISFWLSHVLMKGYDCDAYLPSVFEAIKNHDKPLVIVSNDVSNAMVAETKLGRQFQQAQGRLNQALAALMDRVVYIQAGLVQTLK